MSRGCRGRNRLLYFFFSPKQLEKGILVLREAIVMNRQTRIAKRVTARATGERVLRVAADLIRNKVCFTDGCVETHPTGNNINPIYGIDGTHRTKRKMNRSNTLLKGHGGTDIMTSLPRRGKKAAKEEKAPDIDLSDIDEIMNREDEPAPKGEKGAPKKDEPKAKEDKPKKAPPKEKDEPEAKEDKPKKAPKKKEAPEEEAPPEDEGDGDFGGQGGFGGQEGPAPVPPVPLSEPDPPGARKMTPDRKRRLKLVERRVKQRRKEKLTDAIRLDEPISQQMD